jgi:hypothetical protein
VINLPGYKRNTNQNYHMKWSSSIAKTMMNAGKDAMKEEP